MNARGGKEKKMSASYETVVKFLAAAERRIRVLKDAIRKHEAQYKTGDVNDLCFENDFALYLNLPEHHGKTVEDFVKPEGVSKETWLRNCERYFCSRWSKAENALD